MPPLAQDFISIADYLAGEKVSADKYEYVAGRVYAMANAVKSSFPLSDNEQHQHTWKVVSQLINVSQKKYGFVAYLLSPWVVSRRYCRPQYRQCTATQYTAVCN